MYGGIRNTQRRQELDRNQWAELLPTEFEFVVTGLGEALTEPIYFGRAYDRPPMIRHSVVAALNLPNEVRAISYPVAGLTDHLGWDGWNEDPQFERQMVWNNAYIPELDDDYRGYDQWQVIYKNETGSAISSINPYLASEWAKPGYANNWIQGNPVYKGQPRWAISSDVRLGKAPRPTNYSAKYTFDSSGESRKLTWFSRFYENYGFWGYHQNDTDDVQFKTKTIQFFTDANASNATYDLFPLGGYLELANPLNNNWTLELEIYSTANATFYVDFEIYADGEFVVTDNGTWVPSEEILKEERELVLEQGWNTHYLKFTLPGHVIPNVPDQELFTTGDSLFGSVLFRASGLTGESVYLARSLIWMDASTRPALPFLTVGVAEWIQDEKDAYVGAVLWLKTRNSGALS